MSPESAFTKRSRKCYKAIRKALAYYTAPEDLMIIPGRERPTQGRSGTVYVQVFSMNGPVSSRFYFEHIPTTLEVTQVVDLLIIQTEAQE